MFSLLSRQAMYELGRCSSALSSGYWTVADDYVRCVLSVILCPIPRLEHGSRGVYTTCALRDISLAVLRHDRLNHQNCFGRRACPPVEFAGIK